MHNYSTHIASIFMADNKKTAVWHNMLPEQASRNPFLMHGVLALSASHLRYSRPQEEHKWSLLISHHQNLALPGFREELSRLSEQNCIALFAMASLCVVISMSAIAHGSSAQDDPASQLDAVVQMIVLTRGLWTSLQSVWSFLMRPPMDVLTRGTSIEKYGDYTLPDELASQIQKLRGLCGRPNIDGNAFQAYMAAIKRLEEVFKDLLFLDSADRDENGLVMKWAVSSRPAYTSLVSDRDPTALIILAHYVMLHASLKRWYSDGFCNRAMQAIVDNLPDSIEVKDLLEWPMQQVEDDLPAFSVHRLEVRH
jgi:hypothetical protein